MQSIRSARWLALAALVAVELWPAQGVHPVTGRKYAQPMGVAGAGWLERNEREREENPGAAIKALDLHPGMVVADVGAGTGYFSIRLARLVGPQGKVYATDIQPEMLESLRANLRRENITNVVPVLATQDDPKLPEGEVDLILMVDVYHEFSKPQEMLRRMRTALKPDGELVLLEFRKEDPDVPIRAEHKMSVTEVRAELEAEGYHLEKLHSFLPRQHIFVFGKEPEAK